MEMTAIILIVGFFFFLLINVPVSISIGLATMVAMLINIEFEPAVTTMAQRMAG